MEQYDDNGIIYELARCENNVVAVRSPLKIWRAARSTRGLPDLLGRNLVHEAQGLALPERSGVNDLVSRKITSSQRAAHIQDDIRQRHHVFDADPRH